MTSVYSPKNGGLDWASVKDIDVDAILQNQDEEEEGKLDDLYDMVVSANSEKLAHCEDPVKLFSVMQLLIELTGHDRTEAELDAEKLRRQLDAGQAVGGANEVADLIQKNDALEAELAQTKLELEHKIAEATQQKKETEKLRTKLEARDFEIEQLKDDMEKMTDGNALEKSTRRDLYTLRKDERVQDALQRQLKHANTQLNKQTDQLGALVDNNQQLEAQVKELTEALTKSVEEMQLSSEKVEEFKAQLVLAEAEVAAATRERDVLQHRLDDTEEKYDKHVGSDNAIIESVNATVEKWKTVLSEKDTQIAGMQQVIVSLQKDLELFSKEREQGLMQQVEQQDREIIALTEQLKEATEALDEVTVSRLTTTTTDGPRVNVDQLRGKIIELERQVEELQDEVSDKQRERFDLLHRMDAYERGVYGLHDAQVEIKALSAQIKSMDNDIERKTVLINKVQSESSDLADENEELRGRLGITPEEQIPLTSVRNERQIELEKVRTVNRELLRDIERLEEERRKLKQRLINQALDRGEKAATLGLPTDDLLAAEEYADHFERVGDRDTSNMALQMSMMSSSLPKSKDGPQKELEIATARINELEAALSESTATRGNIARLEEQNALLVKSLSEIGTAISQDSSKPQLSAVDELLAALRADRAVHGDRHSSVALAEEALAHVKGQNAELRDQLKKAQEVAMDAQQAAAKYRTTARILEARETPVEGADGTGLPPDLTKSSAAIVAGLTEQMVELMHELSLRSKELHTSENALNEMKRTLAVNAHQQEILYKEHEETIASHKLEMKQLEIEKAEFESKAEAGEIFESQLQDLHTLLAGDSDDLKKEIGAMDRRNTVHKINNAALVRRLRLLKIEKENLAQKVNSSQQELQDATSWFRDRSSHLKIQNSTHENIIKILQEKLQRSVDKTEVDQLNRRCTTLAAKLRARLDNDNRTIDQGLHVGMNTTINSDDLLRVQTELEHARRRERKLMEQIARLREGKDNESSTAINLQKIQTLEMQILHERQRGDLQELRREKESAIAVELEKRNQYLESKANESSEMHLHLQDEVRDLQDKLLNGISHEAHFDVLKKMDALKLENSKLVAEAEHLQEEATIATEQANIYRLKQDNDSAEKASLQERLLDIESQSDDRTTIGKLHRQILTLKAANNELISRFETTNTESSRRRVQLLRLEEKLEDANASLRRVREESKATSNHLRAKLQTIRIQYAGASTLDEQEKTTNTLNRLVSARIAAEKELSNAREHRATAEDQVAAWQLKFDELQQLLLDLKQGKGSSKVVEWHQKMIDARISELQLKRQLDRAEEQCTFLEDQLDKSERQISALEMEAMGMTKDFEHRQMLWEQREDELEGIIDKNEIRIQQKEQEAEVVMKTVTADFRWTPNSNATIAVQLEEAIHTVHKLAETVLDRSKDLEDARDSIIEREIRMKSLEAQAQQQENIIMDLRLQYNEKPPEGDAISELQNHRDANDAAIKVAQETIASLRELLRQKDEAITKLRQLLTESHNELIKERAHNTETVSGMTAKLEALESEALRKRRESSTDLLGNKIDHVDILNAKVQQLQEELTNQKLRAENAIRAHKDIEQRTAFSTDNISSKLRVTQIESRETIERLESQMKQLHDDNVKLSERNENAEQQQDFLKSHLSAEQEKCEMMTEQIELLKDRHQSALDSIQKKDNTIKKLKYEVDNLSLRHGGGFGSTRHTAANTRTNADETEKLQAKLGKAQDIVKRLKDKQAEADKQRQRAESELTAALGIIQDHETESKKMRSKLSDADKKLREAVKELTTVRNAHDELERKLDRTQTQGTKTDELQKGGVAERQVAELQKRIRILESRGVDAPNTFNKTSSENREQWEHDKRRQKQLDSLRTKVQQQAEELESARAQARQLQDTVTRLERDRSSLQKKLKKLKDAATTSDPTGNPQVMKYQRELSIAQQRIQTLEKDLLDSQTHGLNDASGDIVGALKVKADSEAKRRLASENEKMNLAFELEHAKTEISSLRHKLKVTENTSANDVESSAPVSNVKYMNLLKAHKKLKAQFESKEGTAPTTSNMATARLTSEMDRLKNTLKRERDTSTKLRSKLERFERDRAEQENHSPNDPTSETLDSYRKKVADHIVKVKDQQAHIEKLNAVILRQEDQLRLEGDRIKQLSKENSELHRELDAFDPAFFEEIEDLKHQYSVTVEENNHLKAQISKLKSISS